ncbi:hypothetical protein [Robertkochia aurantiaca]|uniref:hypothetical protein n=1 Tax=Robertkochia aurantiaca TaxID=2873700 RepID=UPI001CCE93BE|nr:hypothetical protein [Robertkochia sp. 3YJGBD-33]
MPLTFQQKYNFLTRYASDVDFTWRNPGETLAGGCEISTVSVYKQPDKKCKSQTKNNSFEYSINPLSFGGKEKESNPFNEAVQHHQGEIS